jgi:hypothetical protein
LIRTRRITPPDEEQPQQHQYRPREILHFMASLALLHRTSSS